MYLYQQIQDKLAADENQLPKNKPETAEKKFSYYQPPLRKFEALSEPLLMIDDLPKIFKPLYKVEPPDFGEEIKDAGKYVEGLAKEKRIIIISDGHHFSPVVQQQINDLIKAAKPKVVALEFGVNEEPITEETVLDEIKKLKDQIKGEGRLNGDTEKMFSLYEERFQALKEAKIKTEFVERLYAVTNVLMCFRYGSRANSASVTKSDLA